MREVYRNRALRRLQLAWAGSIIGTWAYSVAIVVYAYHQGGASAVGLVGLIRFLPAAFAAPFTSVLGDRLRRVPVMLCADLLRALALGAMAACVLGGAPAGAVYALAAAVGIISTACAPLTSASSQNRSCRCPRRGHSRSIRTHARSAGCSRRAR